MFLRKILIISVLVFTAIKVHAETLVTDLSQHEIEITSQFSGSELLLFGAIERHATEVIQSDEIAVQGLDYDIIVIVKSELTDLIIRKKDNKAGIWVNNENITVRDVPGYYAIASTRPLDEFLSSERQAEFGLGLNNLPFVSEGESDDLQAYQKALFRNMMEKGLYIENSGNVEVKNEILFRANLTFPSNMPVGNYRADVYLVRGGDVIINHRTDLLVDKKGIERVIYNFAHEFPSLYGIMAIFVALFAGLFSGFVARKVT